jgi:outer membrane protein assembly factor BamB
MRGASEQELIVNAARVLTLSESHAYAPGGRASACHPALAFRKNTMMRSTSLALLLVIALSLLSHAQTRREWLTWGGDPERTGWNRGETTLSRQTAGRLGLKWKTQIDKEVSIEIESGNSMLTAPLVAQAIRTPQGQKTVLYTLSASNTLAAIDAATGLPIWRRTFDNTAEPLTPPNWICTNMSTATPVIDKAKGIIYLIAADGRLHGVDLATGEAKLIPPPEFVTPFSRNWSLNLVDGVLYTTVGRGCGNGPVPGAPAPPAGTIRGAGAPPAREGVPSETPARGRGRGAPPPPVAAHMIAMDLNDSARPIARFFTSTARPNGAWSRAGLAYGSNSFLVQTADGPWEPQKGLWGQTLLRLAPKTLEVLDYFTPSNLEALNANDLDYGSGGTLEFSYRNRALVVSAGKDGTVYLLDAKSLGGADHRTPLFAIKAGNDELSYASMGVWGAPATFVNSRNERWVYFPMWGPPSKDVKFERTHGTALDGSIMAFQVVFEGDKPVLVPKWMSRNLAVPDSPVIANGLVYAISTGENTLQRHTDPRYHAIFQRPGEPPLPKTGTLTAEERGQNTTHTILYALDAETGQELYSSGEDIDDWTHLSSITVTDGSVYVTTRKTFVYAFGLKK